MGAGDNGDDFFGGAHKGLRCALFAVTSMVGRADGIDDAAVQEVEDEWRDVAMVLDVHQQYEDQYCGPLVQTHAPHLVEALDESHREVDEAIDRIDVLVGRLVAAPPARRPAILQTLYAELAGFLARYLGHLHLEEAAVLPALQETVGPAELAGALRQMHRSAAPDDLCVFLRYLVPGLNPAERVDLLGRLRADTEDETFEQFRSTIEECLAADDYRLAAAAAGFD